MSKIKRLNFVGETYFITAKTKDNIRYFDNQSYSTILLENICYCKQIMNFDLYSFIIMPDHIHILICPKGEFTISQIMHFIKRHTSRQINDKLRNLSSAAEVGFPVAEVGQPQLPDGLVRHIKIINNIFVKKTNDIFLFQWQRGFYDRRIRNNSEFNNVVNYINEKNLADLVYKYKICTETNASDYQFYSFTNQDLINEY